MELESFEAHLAEPVRTVLSLDLLVAAVALHHNAVLVSCVSSVWYALSDPMPPTPGQPASWRQRVQ